MSKFLFFTLIICPILFIIGLFSMLTMSHVPLLAIDYKGWLAIIGMLVFNILFIATYLLYKKQLEKKANATNTNTNTNTNDEKFPPSNEQENDSILSDRTQ